jgi:hypothetical protein
VKRQTIPIFLQVIQVLVEESPRGLVLLFKLVFGCSADGAGPIIRKVCKGGPRLNTTVRVSIGRVIDVATNRANIFIHSFFLLT